MFSKKATKIGKIFTVDLTLCSKCQIDGEDLVNFCGLLRKYELHLYVSYLYNSCEIFKYIITFSFFSFSLRLKFYLV